MHLLAMTESSSKWMLPLLLLLLYFINFHHSMVVLHAFNINVDSFGKLVQNCPDNCGSHITEEICQCVNMSVPKKEEICQCVNKASSQKECVLLHYHIEGLKSLHRNISTEFFVRNLIYDLKSIENTNQKYEFCSLSLKYEPIISPKGLYNKLNDIKERFNNMNAE